MIAGHVRVSCALGRNGIIRNKREGDGATPAGCFRPTGLLYRADRLPRPRGLLPARRLRPGDGWCDDPSNGRYNRPIRLPASARAEELWRADRLYDFIVVLDHNQLPRILGRGSAVFFHVAEPGHAPTAGCIAISVADFRRLLPRLSPATLFFVGTTPLRLDRISVPPHHAWARQGGAPC